MSQRFPARSGTLQKSICRHDRGREVVMAMLPPLSTKPITLPRQCGFSGREKKKSTQSQIPKWVMGSELWEDWAYNCACNSGSPLMDAIGSLKKSPPLEQYITWTSTTHCQTVQTHSPHFMQAGQAYNKMVLNRTVYHIYPMISCFLLHAHGQTLAAF